MKLTKEHVRWVRKGLVSVAGALGVLGVALTEGSPGGTAVTQAELIGVVLAGLAAVGVVVVPNGSKPE